MGIMTLAAAAKELGVSYNWIRLQALEGTIPAMRSGKGAKSRWLVDLELVRQAVREKMLAA